MKRNQEKLINGTRETSLSDNQTKIFKNTLTPYVKTIGLNKKNGDIGNMKYLPSFSKEWSNTFYSFNKNNIKNIPVNNININKIIQSYFNLYFKNSGFIGFPKSLRLRERRTFLRKIYVSDAEIKHTNDKVKITLFTVNREKKILKKKYRKLNIKLNFLLLSRYISLYKNYILKLYSHLNSKYLNRNNYFYSASSKTTPENYILHRLNYLGLFLNLNNLFLKNIWSDIFQDQLESHINVLRKYNLLYSLNRFKFNRLTLLPKLSNLLGKVVGKKIDYNIINLKSIAYNTDIFTRILALKIRKAKGNHIRDILTVLNKAYLPKVNTIQERTKVQTWDNLDLFLNKFKNLTVLNNLENNYNITSLLKNNLVSNLKKSISTNLLENEFVGSKLDKLALLKEKFARNIGKLYKSRSTNKDIYKNVFNSIKYKNMSGIQVEVKGRLTKRYRADRSIFSLRRKGGFKNIDSSFKGLSSVLFRGNTNSNTSYSFSKSKRRIGAFAVKGWIGGK
jgi:hypothetical protein